MHTLPQVYRGVLVGEHCLRCIGGGVNCSNYYVLANKLCTKRGGNCATFYRLMRASLWIVAWTRMKKGLRFSEGLCIHDGGDEGDRTPDLLTASQALSQLSYAPVRRSTIRELPRRCKDNFGKTFGGGAGDAGRARERGARGPDRASPSLPAPGRPPPRGPPATDAAHLLRLGGIPRPWRHG